MDTYWNENNLYWVFFMLIWPGRVLNIFTQKQSKAHGVPHQAACVGLSLHINVIIL